MLSLFSSSQNEAKGFRQIFVATALCSLVLASSSLAQTESVTAPDVDWVSFTNTASMEDVVAKATELSALNFAYDQMDLEEVGNAAAYAAYMFSDTPLLITVPYQKLHTAIDVLADKTFSAPVTVYSYGALDSYAGAIVGSSVDAGAKEMAHAKLELLERQGVKVIVNPTQSDLENIKSRHVEPLALAAGIDAANLDLTVPKEWGVALSAAQLAGTKTDFGVSAWTATAAGLGVQDGVVTLAVAPGTDTSVATESAAKLLPETVSDTAVIGADPRAGFAQQLGQIALGLEKQTTGWGSPICIGWIDQEELGLQMLPYGEMVRKQ